MKRLLIMLTLILTVCLSAFTLSACEKIHVHIFDKEIVAEECFASEATCEDKAKYYYSCTCGVRGYQTFEVGEELGHSFTNYVYDQNETPTQDGTKTATCDNGCGETDIITVPNTTCGISFNTLTLDGTNAYIKVSNETTEFDFRTEITKKGNVDYVVAYNEYGVGQVLTKEIPLSVGDNIVYVFEMFNNEIVETYQVTIRRRPIYTVTFNTNGGTLENFQSVEEDFYAIEPVLDPTRAGYDFSGWDFTFDSPITSNKTINANWTAHTNTRYRVEYYFENIENNDYSLEAGETENLTGTTDTTVYAEIKEFEHFTAESQSVSGNVNGDGSQVLKVYYQRNEYIITNTNSGYGNATNLGEYKYGTELTLNATANYGYKFTGWYNEETLLEDDVQYSVILDKNIAATFDAKTYTLTFNINGGSGTYPNMTVTYNENYTLPTVKESDYKADYYFYGWQDNDVTIKNSGVWLQDEQSTIDLVAKWTVFEFDGTYVYLGEYPQTIKEESVTVGTNADEKGYYTGSDGAKYAKVVANPYSSNYKFSNSEKVVEGSTYYFKVEPIRWRILEEDTQSLTILCDSIIANKRFDDSSNNYKESEIRAWLNNEFYNTAFSSAQQDLINTVLVDNSASSTGYSSNQYACENTNDKVYLISYVEAKNITGSYYSSEERGMKTSDYTRATGVWMNTGSSYYGNGYWWLRSPSDYNDDFARLVNYGGGIDDGGSVNYTYSGVIPALQIQL